MFWRTALLLLRALEQPQLLRKAVGGDLEIVMLHSSNGSLKKWKPTQFRSTFNGWLRTFLKPQATGRNIPGQVTCMMMFWSGSELNLRKWKVMK